MVVAGVACGSRSELLDGVLTHAEPNPADAAPPTHPDAGSNTGRARDAGSGGTTPQLDASSPPAIGGSGGASADAGTPPSDAGTDAALPARDAGPEAGADAGLDASAYCEGNDVLVGDVCLERTCEYGDQGLDCLLADGGVGHCLGVECSAIDLLTDPKNCGLLGGVCPSKEGCSGGHCVSDGTALPCVDANCPPGFSCDRSGDADGVCVTSSCGAGQNEHACEFVGNPYQPGFSHFCCGATCTDLMGDHDNCGYCGHACPGNAQCLDGVCDVDCSSAPDNTPCYDTFSFCCNGSCVQHFNIDSANCNTCGAVCPNGTSCRGGSCSASCFDPGHACPSGQTCIVGPFQTDDVCAATSCSALPRGDLCAALDADGAAHAGSCCGAGCSNLQTDSANCGACGHACAAGNVCLNGVCSPSVDCQRASDSSACRLPSGVQGECCGGSCVDIETDSENCTGCHLACPMGSTCRAIAGPDRVAECLDLGGAQKVCTDTNPCPSGFECGNYAQGLCEPTSCARAADGSACYLPGSAIYNDRCCGGTCTNLSLDSNSCGACGTACPSGTACESQACFVSGTGIRRICGPGAGTSACPAGTACTTTLHGNTCWPTSCSGRSNGDNCSLASGASGTCCGGACTATSVDSKNCGQCGADCQGDLCVSGVCEAIDAASCSPACPAGLVCHQGACYGPVCGDSTSCLLRMDNPYYLLCGTGPYCAARDGKLGFCCGDGSCVDAASDAQNCGACGTACAGGQSCHAGSCQ
jgi:hypothetical protein